MMFKIYDGRGHFYQWDINQKLIVEDSSIKEVHFCNRTDDCSLVCEVYTENGINLVNVPNILFHKCFRIYAYGYDGNSTKHSRGFEVFSRSKPADYVYTETEIKRWEDYAAEVIAEVESYKAEVKAYVDEAKAEIQGGLNEISAMLVGGNYNPPTPPIEPPIEPILPEGAE